MTNYWYLSVSIILVCSLFVSSQISDKRLCADEKCSEIISYAETIIRYSSNDQRILSFPPKKTVKIFSKSAGSRTDLWGAEIDGKRGYVPTSFIRENKVVIKDPTFIVDTEPEEIVTENPSSEDIKPIVTDTIDVNSNSEKPEPSNVSQPYEVIDGTTIYLNPEPIESHVEIKQEEPQNLQEITEPPIVETTVKEEISATPETSSSPESVPENNDETKTPLSLESSDSPPTENPLSTSNKPPETSEALQTQPTTTPLPETTETLQTEQTTVLFSETPEVLQTEPTTIPNPETPEALQAEPTTTPLAETTETTTEAVTEIPFIELSISSEAPTPETTHFEENNLNDKINEATTRVHDMFQTTEIPEEKDLFPKPESFLDNIVENSDQTDVDELEKEEVTTPSPNDLTEDTESEQEEINEEESDLDSEEIEEDAGGSIFDNINFNMFDSVSSMFSNLLKKSDDDTSATTEPETKYEEIAVEDIGTETCHKNNENDCTEEFNEDSPNNVESYQDIFIDNGAYGIVVYLSVTSLTVLFFTLGYYYIDKSRHDGKLIARINQLEKELLISMKENTILKDELQGAKDKLLTIEDSSFDAKGMVLKLEAELAEVNEMRASVEEKLLTTERELETATEAGFELNKMLAEFINSQSGNDSLMESLDQLQKQLNDQQLTIAEMTINENARIKEIDKLNKTLEESTMKNNSLQTDLDNMVQNLVKIQEEKTTESEKLQLKLQELQKLLDNTTQTSNLQINKLSDELALLNGKLKDTQHLLSVKENELTILVNNIKQNPDDNKNSNVSVDDILEISHVQAELEGALQEKKSLTEEVNSCQSTISELKKQIEFLNNTAIDMKSKCEEAEKEKIENQTRLEVLSTYFKEKETELIKELEKHEALWLQNKGEANSSVERIKSLHEEIQSYKSQNELLKKEIVDQEVSLKSQITVLEKRSHENWLQMRQMERRLEESKQEASQLRNRLTSVEKNLRSSDDKNQFRVMSPLNANGEINAMNDPTASPSLIFQSDMPTSPPLPFMGLPPPPPPGVPFMPPLPGVPFMPPPPVLYPGDRRPPPLGRMSSPPPSNTFSPTRAFSPYDRENSPPVSPASRPYRGPNSPYQDMDDFGHRYPPPPLVPMYDANELPRTHWDDRASFRPVENRSNRNKNNGNENV